MSKATILEATNIYKTYPNGYEAVKGVNIAIREGEFSVILGSNGSGKTTLIRCLSGLLPITHGEMIFNKTSHNGTGNSQLKDIRNASGMIFQGANLIDELSVLTNVLIGRLSFMPLWRTLFFRFKDIDREIAFNAIKRVGLQDKVYELAGSLSGGQKQKLAIARAIVKEPAIMFADEPTSNLDPQSSEEIMELLSIFAQKDGKTVVCVLHRLDLAKRYADRIIGIRDGIKVIDKEHPHFTEDDLLEIYGQNGISTVNDGHSRHEGTIIETRRNYCYK